MSPRFRPARGTEAAVKGRTAHLGHQRLGCAHEAGVQLGGGSQEHVGRLLGVLGRVLEAARGRAQEAPHQVWLLPAQAPACVLLTLATQA
jgi:hypothetical protein